MPGIATATTADQLPAPTPAINPEWRAENALVAYATGAMMNPEEMNIAKNRMTMTAANESTCGIAASGRLSHISQKKSRRTAGVDPPARVKRSVIQPQKK